MRNKKHLLKEESQEEISELKNPYFDLQAEMGATKHMGGLKSTEELVELCRINKNKYVLDVGCGVGKTACYIAKNHGCRVVGIDISERMIDRSKERAKREGLENRVEFRAADAQNIPFGDATFDAVISESVTAFPEDKQKALSEYVRVTKKGGYIGLDETTWIKKPSKELVNYLFRSAGGVKPETSDGWKELLEGSGLQDIVVKTYKVKALSQAINEIRMAGFMEIFKAWYRLLFLYITSSAHRRAINGMIKDARSAPRNMFEYYGYGIYVGRK